MLSSFVFRSSRFFHQPTTMFATSSSYSRSSSQFATRTICLATQQSLLCIIFWARSPLDLGSWPAVVLNACCLVSYIGSNASDVSSHFSRLWPTSLSVLSTFAQSQPDIVWRVVESTLMVVISDIQKSALEKLVGGNHASIAYNKYRIELLKPYKQIEQHQRAHNQAEFYKSIFDQTVAPERVTLLKTHRCIAEYECVCVLYFTCV